jgi:hypothetical protein
VINKKTEENAGSITEERQMNNDNEMLDKLKSDIDSLSRRKYEMVTDYNNQNEDSYSVDKEIDFFSKIKVRRKSPSMVTEPSKEKNKIRSKKIEKTQISKKPNVTIQSNTSNKSEAVKALNTENMNNLTVETEKIRNMCKEVEKSLNDDCIMENEKKNLDKLKSEIIRITSDIQNFKDDVKDFKKDLVYLVKKLDYLEIENKTLKQRNYNLFSFVNNFPSNKQTLHNNKSITNDPVNFRNPINRRLIPKN